MPKLVRAAQPRKRPASKAAEPAKTRLSESAKKRRSPLPVVMVTGFLGAGKTTLINKVLRRTKGFRVAVFVNEYGAADVDGELLRMNGSAAQGRVFTLRDGCMCCGGNDDLRNVIAEELSSMRSELDLLIIETSGVTNPVPVMATLAATDSVQIEGVVCVLDATTLSDPAFGSGDDAQRQLACADTLVLSKLDLLSDGDAANQAERQLQSFWKAAVRAAGPTCQTSEPRVLRAAHGDLRFEELFPDFGSGKPQLAVSSTEIDGEHTSFATHSYCSPRAFLREKFVAWAASPPGRLLRAKGLLRVAGESHCMVWHWAGQRSSGLHGVPGSEQPQGSELVFIGTYGEGWCPAEIDKTLDECLVPRET